MGRVSIALTLAIANHLIDKAPQSSSNRRQTITAVTTLCGVFVISQLTIPNHKVT